MTTTPERNSSIVYREQRHKGESILPAIPSTYHFLISRESPELSHCVFHGSAHVRSPPSDSIIIETYRAQSPHEDQRLLKSHHARGGGGRASV